MEPVTLFDSSFQEIGPAYISADIEIGNSSASNDLEITSALPDGCHGIAILGTEAGGVIDYFDAISSKVPTQKTWTWRGLLTQWVLCPPAGSDYLIITNQDCNEALSIVLSDVLGGFFLVPSTSSGTTIKSYQFALYTDALTGIMDMLSSVGMKLFLHAEKDDSAGKIVVYAEAVPIETISGDYDDEDSQLELEFTYDNMHANHMICMGSGELQNRLRVDLYIQEDGTFGETQYYTGFEERQYYYDDNNAADIDTLKAEGLKKFPDVCPVRSLKINSAPDEMEVGDIVNGTCKRFGMSVSATVTKKIYKISGDSMTMQVITKEE